MNAAALLALQDIDSALVALANRRPRLPELAAHRAASAAMAHHLSAMLEVNDRIAAAQAAIEAAEYSAADLTAKRTRLEAQLKTIIAPREAEALMNQIATLNAQRSELDDQELEALDAQGVAEAELAAHEARTPELEAAVMAASAELEQVNAVLAADEAELLARRPAAAGALSSAELAAYDRARAQFEGMAIARLEGHRCGGCHLDLSPAEMDAVKSVGEGSVPECPQCGRVLAR